MILFKEEFIGDNARELNSVCGWDKRVLETSPTTYERWRDNVVVRQVLNVGALDQNLGLYFLDITSISCCCLLLPSCSIYSLSIFSLHPAFKLSAFKLSVHAKSVVEGRGVSKQTHRLAWTSWRGLKSESSNSRKRKRHVQYIVSKQTCPNSVCIFMLLYFFFLLLRLCRFM